MIKHLLTELGRAAQKNTWRNTEKLRLRYPPHRTPSSYGPFKCKKTSSGYKLLHFYKPSLTVSCFVDVIAFLIMSTDISKKTV